MPAKEMRKIGNLDKFTTTMLAIYLGENARYFIVNSSIELYSIIETYEICYGTTCFSYAYWNL